MIGQAMALAGSLLLLFSAIGVLRFDDALARMHALAKGTILGLLLLLGGAAVNLNDINDITSVLLAGMLHVLTSPPASNMVSRAAYLAGAMPQKPGMIDEGAHLRTQTDP